MSLEVFRDLGEFLTSSEATGLAIAFGQGQHLVKALHEVHGSRREQIRALLVEAGLGHQNVALTSAVLEAIAGAKAVSRDLTPVWTMPGNEAEVGHLTGEFYRIVRAARRSVTCATYNFEPTSKMWNVLREAGATPGVTVTVYVDGDKANAAAVKKQLQKATVYQSGIWTDGHQVVSHAKFVIIDHRIVLLTSANFSFSAEKRNIELGLLVDDAVLAESIESTMKSKHGVLYDIV